MKIRPVRTELFHVDRQTDEETDSRFWEILRKYLKTTALLRQSVCYIVCLLFCKGVKLGH